ncbi:MAG: transcription antitermination factor NusB [Polyangiales bacterium]
MSKASTESKRRKEDDGPRRHARECALHVLYGLDAQGVREGELVERALGAYWAHLEGPIDGRPYGDALVRAVMHHFDAIDEAIRNTNLNWRLDRMAQVDRNILRIATYEIVFSNDVPAEVAINEAVDLAKRFGSAESPAFVNGTLDKLARTKGKLR